MDLELRQNQRQSLLNNDHYAFRHNKRISGIPARTLNQIFGEHVRDIGFQVKYHTNKVDGHQTVCVAFEGEKILTPFSRVLWGQENSLQTILAIFRVGLDEFDAVMPCSTPYCQNLAFVAGNSERDFCYNCAMSKDYMYPERKVILERFYHQAINNGYDHQGAGLLASNSYSKQVSAENTDIGAVW